MGSPVTNEELLDDALGHLEDAFSAHGLEALVQPTPWSAESIAELAATMRQAGFRLPASYHSALTMGAIHIPLARHLRVGFSALDAEGIFGSHLQARAQLSSGVQTAGAWLVFGTQHGDYEPARVFDRRFVTNEGELEVAWYHQDDVCEVDYTHAHLPEAFSTYASWFRAAAIEAKHALSDDEAVAGYRKTLAVRQNRQPRAAPDPSRWQDLSAWSPNNWWTYSNWLRTGDASFAADIVARIEREVFGPGATDEAMARHFRPLKNGAWPYRYPSPADLCSRLDDGARRRLLHALLVDGGLKPSTAAAHRGLEFLANGQRADQDTLFAVADEDGWALETHDRLSSALNWSLGPLSAQRLALIFGLIREARTTEGRTPPTVKDDWTIVAAAWRKAGSP